MNNCNNDLLNSSGASLTALAGALAISISNQYNSTDLNTIAAFLTAVADLIALNAQQKSRCEEMCETIQGEKT